MTGIPGFQNKNNNNYMNSIYLNEKIMNTEHNLLYPKFSVEVLLYFLLLFMINDQIGYCSFCGNIEDS